MTREEERRIAAELGEGPLVMFDDGLPLKFLHGQKPMHDTKKDANCMGDVTKQENDWLDKASAAAIAGARKIALGNSAPMNTPVRRLSDHEWSMIVTAVIFGWIEVRVQQAISEGLDQEQTVRMTNLSPDPCEVAVVTSILPTLADTAGIDWSLPLTAWTGQTMTNFLMLAWQLVRDAEHARDHGPGKVLNKAEFDEKTGDAIPF